MKKRAVILIAGMGRRMGNLTKYTPKSLLHILGKPILFHNIDNLSAIGINDITVVTGYKSKKIQKKIEKSSHYSFPKCIFNPFYRYTESIVSLWLFLRFNQIDNHGVIVVSGDRILHPDIYQALKETDKLTLVGLGPKEYPITPRDSIVIKNNRVISIGEKSSYVFGGILYIPGNKISVFLDSIEKVLSVEEGTKKWYLEGMNEIIKRERINALTFPLNFCVNINRPSDLENSRIKRILGGISDA